MQRKAVGHLVFGERSRRFSGDAFDDGILQRLATGIGHRNGKRVCNRGAGRQGADRRRSKMCSSHTRMVKTGT